MISLERIRYLGEISAGYDISGDLAPIEAHYYLEEAHLSLKQREGKLAETIKDAIDLELLDEKMGPAGGKILRGCNFIGMIVAKFLGYDTNFESFKKVKYLRMEMADISTRIAEIRAYTDLYDSY